MAGGWSPAQVARFKNIKVPDKIKCAGCQTQHPLTEFSESQIARIRKKLTSQGNAALTQHTARCLYCTGGALPTEIQCFRCQITKPREAFTKVQRIDWGTAVCKTCTAYFMTSETWEEELEKNIEKDADGYTETASTIDESVDGGVPLELFKSFSVSSQSTRRGRLHSKQDRNLGAGLWLEDDDAASTTVTEDKDDLSTKNAPSSAAGYSGWDFPALNANASRPTAKIEPQSTRKNWARIRSADPTRNARILKMSDPLHHLNDEEDLANMQQVSTNTMVGAHDRTKLHQEIHNEDLGTTYGDDGSTVTADPARPGQ